MKRIIFIMALIAITLTGLAQNVSIWKPVPKNLFTIDKYGAVKLTATNAPATGVWLWRWDANVVLDELVYHSDIKQYVSTPLSAIGPAIGFKHYVPLSDGTAYNDFSITGAVLLGTDVYKPDLAAIKIAVMAEVFEHIKLGLAYTPNTPANIKHLSFVFGGSIGF